MAFSKLHKTYISLLAIFIILTICLSTGGYILYLHQKSNITQEKNNELATINKLKIEQIVNWRNNLLTDARTIFYNQPVITHIHEFNLGINTKSNQQIISKWGEALLKEFEYTKVLIVNPDGKVILNSNPDELLTEAGKKVIAQAVKQKEIVFSDFNRYNDKTICIFIAIPLYLEIDTRTLFSGVALVNINPENNLFPLIKLWPIPSLTGETLIYRREGDSVLVINDLRHYKNGALRLRKPMTDTLLPAIRAAMGYRGIVDGVDYRGVKILADLDTIEDTHWLIVTKIDTDEIFQPIHKQALWVLIITFLLIFVSAFIIYIIWVKQSSKSEQERLTLLKHFDYLVKYANDIVILSDFKGNICEANDKTINEYGYSREEILNMNIKQLRAPETKDLIEKQLDLIKENDGIIYETLHIRKNGEIFPIESSGRRMEVDGITYYQFIVRDITERKQAELALLKLEKAIYTSGEAIFLTDREGVFTFINPSFTALYGFTSDEIVGKVTPRIITSGISDKAAYEYFWQTLLNGDEVKGELINKKKDGTLIHIDSSSTPILDEKKNIIGFLGIQHDITDRKQVEEKIKIQSDAMEAAIDGLAILNSDQKFIFINKSYAEIHGYDNADELIGGSWKALYEKEELQRFSQVINPEIREKRHFQGRAWGKKKDGTVFPQDLSLTALTNGGMICTVRNITELIHAEQELITAKDKAEESDRLKTAFLYNISHEIRTPFNGILGFLSMIQDEDLSEIEKGEYIRFINQSADRLMNTIDDLVEISQIQAGQIKLTKQETNIKNLTEELLDRFEKEVKKSGLEFIISNNIPQNVIYINTDSIKLKTILSNLIGNAIKFTKKGSIALDVNLKGDYFEFSVKDTGIGIAKSKQPFIFERFNQVDSSVTRQFEGLGLGLSITRSYVEVLGGRIWLESDEGKGSIFYFTIPYSF